jgi:acyl-CoA synthetase (AMP-forming)/AMP-acid ligase II
MNLLDVYRANAADRGSATALTFVRPPHEGVALTWEGLLGRAAVLRDELREGGVGTGTRAAVMLLDHPDTLPTFLALWELEAIPILADRHWGESIRSSVLAHSGADAIVSVGDRLVVQPGPVGSAGRPPMPASTAVVAYTSGSTGSPKGIPLRHERVVAALQSSASSVNAFCGGPPARVASSMRISGYGVLALHYLWSAMSAAEVVVLPELDLVAARSYWADLAEHQIDRTVLVPPLFELLARASDPGSNEHRPLFVSASGAISPTTHARFQEQFGAVVLNAYGLTELSFACMFGDMDSRGTSTQAVGRPDIVLARLRRPHGEVVLGPGEGELEARGPTVSDGYYDNPEANASLFDGPWIRSGDLARRDETGKYWIVGRLKDAVMKGGHTVYLTEVEEAAVAVDGVLEAVAVRMDLPAGNEDLGLIVRPVEGADLEAQRVKEALDRALGVARNARRVLVTDQPLPRTGPSKIDRRGAEALWADLAKAASARERKRIAG